MPSYIELQKSPNELIPNAEDNSKLIFAVSSSGVVILKDNTGNNMGISSSYSIYSTSASYAPSQVVNTSSLVTTQSFNTYTASLSMSYLPDITDDILNQFIGINQLTPQFALDVNGIIGNSVGDLIIAGNSYGSGIINIGSGSWVNGNTLPSIELYPSFTGNRGGNLYLNAGDSSGNENGAGGGDIILTPGHSASCGYAGKVNINNGETLILNPNSNGYGAGISLIVNQAASFGQIFNRYGTLQINQTANGGIGYGINIQADDGSDYNGNIGGNITLMAGNGSVTSGNVGINTLTPQYSLDISGSVNFTGNILKNGLPYTASLAVTAASINFIPNLSNTASYVITSQTSSYITASNIQGTVASASYSLSASYIKNTISSSLSLSSSISSISGGSLYYLPLVTGSGNQPFFIDTSDLKYNQLTGQTTLTSLSASSVTASLFGTASYSSIATVANNVSQSNLIGTSSLYSQAYILTGSYSETITSPYTLTSVENGKLLIVNASSNTKITVPTTLPRGFACSMFQSGSGQVVVSGSGVNIRNRAGLSASYAQYSVISLLQLDSSSYLLAGDVG